MSWERRPRLGREARRGGAGLLVAGALLACPPAPPELRPGAPAIHLRHPAGQASAALRRLCAALASRDELVIPAGSPGSELSPTRARQRRLQALMEVLVLLESRGVHRDGRGELRRSPAPGAPLGYTQVSAGAARDAAAFGGRLGWELGPGDPALGREEPERNLQLGTLYLLRIHQGLPEEADAELRVLRSLAGYLAGPAEPWVRASPEEFRRAAGARPEVRRYLRQAILMLELGTRGAAWKDALGGPRPWPQEARDLRAWRAAAWGEGCDDR